AGTVGRWFRLRARLCHGRDAELRAVLDARWPALGDGFDLCVELDRRGPVLVQIAEAGPLPTAKGVVGHRNRDRYVDTDHADLDPGGEVACGVAVASKDRHAVAVLVL